jgi:hypothetical protein
MNMSTEHPDSEVGHVSQGRSPTPAPGHDNPDVAHEHSDINVRGVIWFVAILLVSAVVIHVAMWGLLKLFEARTSRNDPPLPPLSRGEGPHPPPAPRLQTRPIEDLKQWRANDEAQLSGYSWVDKQAGIVRVPIDRAKQLYIERAKTAAPVTAPEIDIRARETASGRFVK